MLLKFFTGFITLWNDTPKWMRWFAGLFILPNLVVTGIVFFMFVVPWQDNKMNAAMMTMKDRRDIEIKHIVERQNYQYESISTSIQRIEQHQGLIYQSLLQRRPAEK